MNLRSFVLVLALGTVSSPVATYAQRGSQPPKNPLPASAMDKLRALDKLNELPTGQWRVHTGDIEHGEAVDLNDANWPTLPGTNPKGPANKLGGAAWLRHTIEIPADINGYNIAGTRIWFQAHIGARGPSNMIVYVNGNRVAMGEDLEPIVLTESAKPGEKFLIAVKALETPLGNTFNGVSFSVVVRDPNRPHPEDIRQEALAASELLGRLPKPRPDLLPKVEAAVNAIDLGALKRGDNVAFDSSLRAAQQMLEPLHQPLSTYTADVVGNSHIDAAWLWPKTTTVDIVHRTFGTAIQLMREYPDYKYAQSAAQYSQWIADNWPDLNKEIAQRVKEGRWELVGGMWVEPDLNLPGGESIVRQLLVGQRVFKDLYGTVARIGWNPDTFGYNWQMPQIYKRSGIDYFVTQKMGWNDTNQLPLRLFWWQGLDGTRILTYFPKGYGNNNLDPSRLADQMAVSSETNPGSFLYADLYGVGDHGGGPTRKLLDQGEHWAKASAETQDAVPAIHFTTFGDFFSGVETHLNPDAPVWNYERLAKGWSAPPAGPNGEIGVPVWADELYLEKHRGVYTTQAKHKWNMRHSEDATIDAEKFASVAWIDGATYPATQFTDNWKNITFNQFHDLGAGSGIGIIYKDAQKEYDQVFAADKTIDDASHKLIAARVDTGNDKNGVPVLVWNTMSWPRSGIVEFPVQMQGTATAYSVTDSAGKHYPSELVTGANGATLRAWVPDVPATGYKLLHVRAAHSGSDSEKSTPIDQGSAFELANGKLSVSIRKSDGCVTSVRAGATEYLAPNACGNELQTYVDKPKQYDAWDIDPDEYDPAPTRLSKVDAISVLENTPLRKTVRITRSWSKSRFIEDITLDAGADYVSFNSTVDWHEDHILLKAAFPFAATGPKATYEIPFGAIERETTRDNTFTRARFEVSAQRWADLGDGKQGVSLLNDAKYGYDTLGNVMRLTLLRSPKDPDPDADMGIQHMRYAIYPHTGTWQSAQTVHRGYEFDVPMTAEQVFAHPGKLPAEMSFAAVDNPNVVIAAIKKAEDTNALIVRVYETSGASADVALHVPAGATAATEANMMEVPDKTSTIKLDGATIHFPIKPFEIRTIEVSYGK